MKKNLFFAVILSVGLIAIINSCVKETFTEEDAYSEQRKNELLQDSIAKSKLLLEESLATKQALLLDSLRKVGGVINYSVAAVLASESSWWSDYFGYYDGDKGEKGLDGVTITLAQHGRTFSITTDASGIGSFKDLRIGTANVNISKTGYTEVNYVVDLPPLTETMQAQDTFTLDVYELIRHVATMVPVFSLTTNLSTISGIATVESDLTNDAPEIAPNVKIMGIIDVDDPDFWIRYMYDPSSFLWKGGLTDSKSVEYYGKIKQIAFHSTISTVTTGADGSFSLQVPSTPNGLPIRLEFSDFALNQTLLQATKNMAPVWGVQTIRTLFGADFYSYSSVPAIGVANGDVQSAYVEFSAPTGTPAAQPTTAATATAVLSSSGIVSVNITNPGSGYTQPPRVVISHGSGWNSINAEGTAVLTNGSVSAVTITNAGTGYLPGDTPTLTFSEAIDVTATATPIFSYSLIGFSAFTAGSNYTSTPPTISIVGDGTGATARAVMAGNITKANITNSGGGYTAVPKVIISDGKGNTDLAATADMSDFAPIASVTYVKPATVAAANLYDGPPAVAPVVVISGGAGSGATATCTLSTTGQITGFTITAPGALYTTATVSITGGGGWAQATATIGVGGVISGITVTDGGFGYTTAPTVTITGDGSGAAATATIRFPISSVNLTNGGSSYNVLPAFEPVITVGGNIVPAADIFVKYLMLVEGITYNAATNYEAQPVATITPIDGAGSGAAVTFDVSWKINALVVDNQGSGYTHIPNVIIGVPQTGGTTATATATLGNGVLKEVIVDQPGKGYTAAPHAEINVAGVPYNVVNEALLAASVANGQVTGITVSDPGTGYPYLTTYTVKISTFKTPGAATAKPNPRSGQIDFIQVDNPGAGYVVVPTIEIVNSSGTADANRFGTGATATAVVLDGRVSAINVTNAGTGYYAVPTVRVTVAASVMKAMAKCVVSTDGRITGVDFTGGYPGYQFTKGFGYTSVPTVTFFPSVTGKGTGAAGVAVLNNGSVESVVMTNQGSGYTGRNKPLTKYFTMTPDQSISATAGKTYIRDLNFGTGKRTIEQ